MELIDITPTSTNDPHFRPQTPDQLSSCTPVVDFHHLRWNQHCSERFQNNALFLGSTYKEKTGFDSLEHYESHEAEAPLRRT